MRSCANDLGERASWCAKYNWITKHPCLKLTFILCSTNSGLTKTGVTSLVLPDHHVGRTDFSHAALVKQDGALIKKACSRTHMQYCSDTPQRFKRFIGQLFDAELQSYQGKIL